MWTIERPLTEQQVEREARLRLQLTGALTTMLDKQPITTGPRTPWWWTGDDDAASSSVEALSLFHAEH